MNQTLETWQVFMTLTFVSLAILISLLLYQHLRYGRHKR